MKPISSPPSKAAKSAARPSMFTRLNLHRLVVTYGGKAAQLPTDPVTRSVLKGFLELAGGKEVNQVNVRTLANSLGLEVQEIKSSEETDFNEWLHVAVFS